MQNKLWKDNNDIFSPHNMDSKLIITQNLVTCLNAPSSILCILLLDRSMWEMDGTWRNASYGSSIYIGSIFSISRIYKYRFILNVVSYLVNFSYSRIYKIKMLKARRKFLKCHSFNHRRAPRVKSTLWCYTWKD